MAIITLTSDIGPKDYLPGAVKGTLLSVNPGFNIQDITHAITPFNYNEAVYIIRNSYHHFPLHSYHLLLINMFDAADSRLIMAYHQGHYFVCADNGLLPMIFNALPDQAIELPLPADAQTNILGWVEAAGKAIAAIEKGSPFHLLGKETDQLREKHSLKPVFGDDWIEGNIIFIDRFENVVVNITREEFEAVRKGRQFTLQFKRDETITRISDSYASVAEGSKLAFFNTAGYLEIAVNKGNAAGLFGLHPADAGKAHPQFMQTRMFYQTIRIFFE